MKDLEDNWVTIGHFEFAKHEGTFFARPTQWYEKRIRWEDIFEQVEYTECYPCLANTFSDLGYDKDGIPFKRKEKKCFEYYAVDTFDDLIFALSLFQKNGLPIRLTCKQFKELVDAAGLGSEINCSFNRGQFIKDYYEFRHSVLKRDNHTCFICGEHSNLEVHHIFPFRQYLSLGTDVNNAITLCANCHQDFHNRYGYTSDKVIVNFFRYVKRVKR